MPDFVASPGLDYRFVADGHAATADDVKAGLHTVLLADDPTRPTLASFSSERALLKWAAGEQQWPSIAQLVDTARLLREDGPSAHSQRLQHLRHEHFSPVFDGRLHESAVVHEHEDGTGGAALLPRSIPCPDFAWYGMDKKGTSLSFWLASGFLAEEPGYRGRCFWFLGLYANAMKLRVAGWERTASSGFSF